MLAESVVGVILQEIQLHVKSLGDSSNERQVKDEPGDIPDYVCSVIVQMDGWYINLTKMHWLMFQILFVTY